MDVNAFLPKNMDLNALLQKRTEVNAFLHKNLDVNALLQKKTEVNAYLQRKMDENAMIRRKKPKGEEIRILKDSVIPMSKIRIVEVLEALFDNEADRSEFAKLCKRVEYVVRAWYITLFENMMELYSLFDPVHGASKIKERKLSHEVVDKLEQEFLSYLFLVMKKTNFNIVTDQDFEVAQSGNYLINLPIVVDETKVDNKLLSKYFEKHPEKNLPEFSDKPLAGLEHVFLCKEARPIIIAIGIDTTSDFFYMAKLDIIISRSWAWFLKKSKLERIYRLISSPKSMARSTSDLIINEESIISEELIKSKESIKNNESVKSEESDEDEYMTVERISLQNIEISLGNLLRKVEIQEPTFDRMIVVYRKASTTSEKDKKDRGIYIKHFKNIPMADMELVLPEKKNPSLTPMDWVQFIVSVIVGLVALLTSMETPSNDLWVAIAIISALVGYCAKIYFSFQQNMETYQNMITQSMYDKQLDSGKGTLLHLCDDVIQQEVKEVIVSYFVLLKYGGATISELGGRCDKLIKEHFEVECNFDEADALQKLEKLGIVTRDEMDRITCLPLHPSNEKIGPTTEELVLGGNSKHSFM